MSDDAGFLIDGTKYEIPDFSSLTFDECEILTDKTGLTVEFIMISIAEGSLTFLDLLNNPGVLTALVTIAYVRKHPDEELPEVQKIVGGLSRVDMAVALMQLGDDPDPPSRGATSAPPEQSQNGSNSSTPSTEPTTSDSGPSSTPSSVKQVSLVVDTGITASDMLHTSAPVRSDS